VIDYKLTNVSSTSNIFTMIWSKKEGQGEGQVTPTWMLN